MTEYSFRPIARIRSVFPDKFGIPRQSGLTELSAEIVFEPRYRVKEAFRGIETYSHLWLIWVFSESAREEWSPTVRPPRLGGNTRMGVFATRSPFRPSPVGLSAVRLVKTEFTEREGPVLTVSGADLMNGTPILDIKPYLAYADAYPEAVGGFSDPKTEERLAVEFPPSLLEKIPEALRGGLLEILEQDPRPGYQNAPQRLYHLRFHTAEIGFRVEGKTLIVTEVCAPPIRE